MSCSTNAATRWSGTTPSTGPRGLRRSKLRADPFAPNHNIRPTVTALAIGNIGKRGDAAASGHAVRGHAAGGHATGDCCDSCDKPHSHDTCRIAWPNGRRGWGRSFRWSARGAAATSDSLRS